MHATARSVLHATSYQISKSCCFCLLLSLLIIYPVFPFTLHFFTTTTTTPTSAIPSLPSQHCHSILGASGPPYLYSQLAEQVIGRRFPPSPKTHHHRLRSARLRRLDVTTSPPLPSQSSCPLKTVVNVRTWCSVALRLSNRIVALRLRPGTTSRTPVERNNIHPTMPSLTLKG